MIMKNTSQKYKQEMKEPWRNRWLLKVTVDAINNDVQSESYITSQSPFLFLSKNYKTHILDKNYKDYMKYKIATFEQDFISADGSYQFMDKAHTGVNENYFGYISDISQQVQDEVSIWLALEGKIEDIKIITFIFDEEIYPEMVECHYSITGRDERLFGVRNHTGKEVHLPVKFPTEMIRNIRIVFKKFNKPNVGMRLNAILFGDYINADNEDILLSGNNFKSFTHPCSLELPNENLNLSFDNSNNKYDFLDPQSPVHLLKEGQKLDLRFSYVNTDGSIEKVEPYVFQLDKFSNKGNTFNITGVDFFRNENAIVNFKIRIGTTLDSIIQSYIIPQLTDKNFKIIYNREEFKKIEFKDRDPEYAGWPLKGEPTKIETSVKDCLKMIASAASCVMRLDGENLYLDPINEKNIGLMTIDSNMFLNNMPVAEPKKKIRHIRTYYYAILPLIQAMGNVGYWRSVVDEYYNDVNGANVIYENPFIFSEAQAKKVTNDLRRYYNEGYSYDFEFIGDPSLESGDSINLENRTGMSSTVLIESHDISFTNGGVRGKITAKG